MTDAIEFYHLFMFQRLEQDPIFQLALRQLAQPSETTCRELHRQLLHKAETHRLAGPLWPAYFYYRLLTLETLLSQTAEQSGGQLSAGLRAAAQQDLEILLPLLALPGAPMLLAEQYTPSLAPKFPPPYTVALEKLLQQPQTADGLVDTLAAFYAQNGSGTLSASAALRWTKHNGLQPLQRYDTIQLDHLVGCEEQKAALIANTQALLKGKPAHHVLLCGGRGTGKSSAVKGLLHLFAAQGLRLVEITKDAIGQLEQLIDDLGTRGPSFILFLDDLSFEANETEYKHLKSVMEGGLSPLPVNVRVYATSNRRHLIRETFSDRGDSLDEIHGVDTVNEKISLVDRFGLSLTFHSPSQQEFIAIAAAWAQRHKLDISAAELSQLALRWEMSHSGRSGRIAKQLIEDLLARREG